MMRKVIAMLARLFGLRRTRRPPAVVTLPPFALRNSRGWSGSA